MSATGTYEPPVASGGGLKSVTKTYIVINSSGSSCGLTDDQRAGLYSMHITECTYVDEVGMYYPLYSSNKIGDSIYRPTNRID